MLVKEYKIFHSLFLISEKFLKRLIFLLHLIIIYIKFEVDFFCLIYFLLLNG